MEQAFWRMFELSIAELILFIAAGFSALYYRGKWINEKCARTNRKEDR